MMNKRPVRLNKYLAERLGVSRREADELIDAGRITINGRTATLGDRVNVEARGIDKIDKVCYNNKAVPEKASYSYIAFNKPVGYVCSRHAQGPAPTIYDLLPKDFYALKTVGRLDKDSSGLILLTNDGDFAFSMTHPSFRKNKVYEVELDKKLQPLHQQMIMEHGVEIGDGVSRFKIIHDGMGAHYIVILSEGRNRQIRRTFAALGYKVVGLHRTQFGKYELGEIKPGKYAIIKP